MASVAFRFAALFPESVDVISQSRRLKSIVADSIERLPGMGGGASAQQSSSFAYRYPDIAMVRFKPLFDKLVQNLLLKFLLE